MYDYDLWILFLFFIHSVQVAVTQKEMVKLTTTSLPSTWHELSLLALQFSKLVSQLTTLFLQKNSSKCHKFSSYFLLARSVLLFWRFCCCCCCWTGWVKVVAWYWKRILKDSGHQKFCHHIIFTWIIMEMVKHEFGDTEWFCSDSVVVVFRLFEIYDRKRLHSTRKDVTQLWLTL